MSATVVEELARRRARWEELHREGGPTGVPSYVLRQLHIYGGAQGIWVDKTHTASLTSEGVTVALLYKGTRYADDLADDRVLYHYPQTRRPPGRDLAEVEATKAAGRLQLPVFVISQPRHSRQVRSVHLGWVEDWNDEACFFLVTFGEAPTETAPPSISDDTPFNLVDTSPAGRRAALAHPGQQRFKFRVIERYGYTCAVCDMAVPELLDAAHIRPKQEHGSDDPRNGLLLCALHHRAWDADLFGIEPATLRIRCRPAGPSVQSLGIRRESLAHLRQTPHPMALDWRWQRWRQTVAIKAG